MLTRDKKSGTGTYQSVVPIYALIGATMGQTRRSLSCTAFAAAIGKTKSFCCSVER